MKEEAMNEISLALDPPKFVKRRSGKPPIRLVRSPTQVWPLAALNGREPVVLAPTCAKPRGIELAYPRLGVGDAVANCPPGTANGTDAHLMPHMTAALSIDDGEIVFAGRQGHGYGVIIHHSDGWGSYYANLESIAAIRTDIHRPRTQYVRAGNVIGYVGAPSAGAFKRLYFELWQVDRSRIYVPVDPRQRLSDWKLIEHYDHFTPAPPTAQQEAA